MCGGVIGMLATHAGVLCGHARAVRAVAGGACWHLAVRNTTTVNTLTQRHQLFFLGKTRFDFFRCRPVGDVAHVVIAERGRKAFHNGVIALARFIFRELLDQIIRVLLRQLGVARNRRIAICTVAGRANR